MTDRGKIGKQNKAAGSREERRIVNRYKEIGFDKARTSRQASRLLDDSKVDIAFVPFNHQCKKGYVKGINYTKVFEEMEEELVKNFPEDDKQLTLPKVINHNKGRKKTEKLVIMLEDDYFELIKKLNGRE